MIINDFLTTDILTSFWGLIVGTVLFVQFTKPIIKNKFNDIAVRIYTFLVALILTFTFARQGNDIQGIVLTILNSITVSIGAMGSYEIIVDPYAEKSKEEDING